VDCIHAGFPCVDVSKAGTGKGVDGARSGLVFEAIRVVDTVKPRFVLLENSPVIQAKGRHRIIAQLVEKGYSWRDGILSAADVGANHGRSRWWLLAANANGLRELQQEGCEQDERGWPDHSAKAQIPNTMRERLEGKRKEGTAPRPAQRDFRWWQTEPEICGVDDGVPDRVHQIKALGNGQVPLQAAMAWRILSRGSA